MDKPKICLNNYFVLKKFLNTVLVKIEVILGQKLKNFL
jgi:hypothetical protein